jgi:thiamine biosynthesis lipoprotein
MMRTLSALLCALLTACGAQPTVEPFELSGTSMGTTWSVKLAEPPPAERAAALRGELALVLDSVDRSMSTFRPKSELSRFNASRSGDWFAVSAQTAMVVAKAQDIATRTGGAFDVTAGPLVNLWGFGPEPRPARAPSDGELRAARAATGYGRLEVRATPPALRMPAGKRYVDLSGIAKGFAVDALAEQLEARGIADYLVEVGGELRAGGRRSRGEPWKIGLEQPIAGGRTLGRVLVLEDRAVATSGDYRNFRELDGERVTHVLDPRNGHPVRTGVASASVVCATAMEADALATALMVLGPAEGLSLARREQLAVQLVLREGEELVTRSTTAFEALVFDPPARASLGLYPLALGVMLLAMAGLAAGLLLRGRPLSAGCRRELGTATRDSACWTCATPHLTSPPAAASGDAHGLEAPARRV